MAFSGQTKRFLCGLILIATCGSPLPAAPPADPVELLRDALYIRLDDTRNPPMAVLEHRRKVLEERVAALKSIRDLRRALTLSEWKEDIGEESVRVIDEEMRRKIGERFRKAIRKIIITDDPASRLAIANMIGEMGPTIRALDRVDTQGFARGLADDVIALCKDPNLSVRLEALRTLGTINADPAKAVPVLREALEKGDPQEKRVAAYALGQLVRVVNHLLKRGQSKSGIEASREDFVRTAAAVVDAVGKGMQDADVQVRQLSLEAVDTAAHALGDFILEPFPRSEFPPTGRTLTPEDLELMDARALMVKSELAHFEPLLRSLKAQDVGLLRGLSDRNPGIRLLAITTLENIAYVRGRILRWIDSIPDPRAKRENGTLAPDHWASKVFVDPLAGVLGKSLGAVVVAIYDPEDVRVRRVGVDFFERLGEAAAPAVDALADRLADEDRFVRWSAARTLGNLVADVVATPKRLEAVVLGLTNLLADGDLDVRMAAAETLKEVGPPAVLAMSGLTQAIVTGDAENRVAALQALARIGLKGTPPTVAEGVIQNLLVSLGAAATPDARVRRAAAETLALVGPQLPRTATTVRQRAVSALRDALGDDDGEVRSNAGDAILSIQQGDVD